MLNKQDVHLLPSLINDLIVIAVLGLFFGFDLYGQSEENLIQNSKFKLLGQIEPLGWDEFGTPDLRSEFLGSEKYYGVLLYRNNTSYREYLGNILTQRLKKGKSYMLTFDVRRCNYSKNVNHKFIPSKLGIKLLKDEPTKGEVRLPNKANQLIQVKGLPRGYDWQSYQVDWIAQDEYKYLAFGCFDEDSITEKGSKSDLESFTPDPNGGIMPSSYYCFKNFNLLPKESTYNYGNCGEKVVSPGKFNRDSVEYLITMKSCKGIATIEYDMRSAPDHLKVYNHPRERKREKPIYFSGGGLLNPQGKAVSGSDTGSFVVKTDTVRVVVLKSNRSESDTRWNFTISCCGSR